MRLNDRTRARSRDELLDEIACAAATFVLRRPVLRASRLRTGDLQRTHDAILSLLCAASQFEASLKDHA